MTAILQSPLMLVNWKQKSLSSDKKELKPMKEERQRITKIITQDFGISMRLKGNHYLEE